MSVKGIRDGHWHWSPRLWSNSNIKLVFLSGSVTFSFLKVLKGDLWSGQTHLQGSQHLLSMHLSRKSTRSPWCRWYSSRVYWPSLQNKLYRTNLCQPWPALRSRTTSSAQAVCGQHQTQTRVQWAASPGVNPRNPRISTLLHSHSP